MKRRFLSAAVIQLSKLSFYLRTNVARDRRQLDNNNVVRRVSLKR